MPLASCALPWPLTLQAAEGRPLESLAVIVYILLCGLPPFHHNNENLMYEKIKRGAYAFVKPQWDPISEDAKQFIAQMLLVNPKERSTIAALLQDKWLSTSSDFDLTKGKDYNKLNDTKEKLALQRKFQQGMSIARAQVRLARAMKRALRRSQAKTALHAQQLALFDADASEVFVTSLHSVLGSKITSDQGLVGAAAAVPVKASGGSQDSQAAEWQMERLRAMVVAKLRRAALATGSNAVVGFSISLSTADGSFAAMANGTAVSISPPRGK